MRTALITVAGFLLMFVAVVSLFLHFNPLCGEDVMSEEIPPDGVYVAVLMERDCGATTPFVDHINLRLAISQFRPNFIDGTIKGGEIFVLPRRHEGGVRFDWLGPRRLEIAFPDTERTFYHKNEWRDVHIEYPYQH